MKWYERINPFFWMNLYVSALFGTVAIKVIEELKRK